MRRHQWLIERILQMLEKSPIKHSKKNIFRNYSNFPVILWWMVPRRLWLQSAQAFNVPKSWTNIRLLIFAQRGSQFYWIIQRGTGQLLWYRLIAKHWIKLEHEYSTVYLLSYLGVSHADDLLYLFPMGQRFFHYSLPSIKDEETQAALTELWVNFARTGWAN